MSPRPRLFVSFARDPEERASRVFAALQRQPFEVWNHDAPSHAAPLGSALRELLEAQVRRADRCVFLVTRHAFENPHTRFELETALRLQKPLYPLVDRELAAAASPWPAPFSALQPLLFATATLDDRTSVGRAVKWLCDSLGVDYVPHFEEPANAPLVARFYRELAASVPRTRGRANDRFPQIVELLEEADDALSNHDVARADSLLELAIRLVHHEYPGRRLYYPRLILALQKADAGAPLEALALLEAITQESTDDGGKTLQDACLPAAFVRVLTTLGRYDQALAQAKRAVELPHADVFDRLNLLHCKLRAGEPVALDCELARLDSWLTPTDDAAHLELGKAVSERLAGAPGAAVARLEHWLENHRDHHAFLDAVAEFAHSALVHDRPSRARLARLLASLSAGQALSPQALDAWGRLHLGEGRRVEAAAVYDRLAQAHHDTGATFCALWGLAHSARDRARALAHRFLQRCPRPRAEFDFYVAGYAHFLLGNQERAQHDLERSGVTGSYDELAAP